MSNSFYQKGLQGFAAGDIDWDANTFKAFLVKEAYAPNLATDQFISDVVSGNRIGSASPALTTKTNVLGKLSCDNIVFTAPPAGTDAAAIVIFKDTGTESTSPLVAYLDGEIYVVCSVAYTPTSATLNVDKLNGPIPAGTSIVFGAVTIVTAAAAAINARTLTVVPNAGSVAVNATGTAFTTNSGFPATPDGVNSITFVPDATGGIGTI